MSLSIFSLGWESVTRHHHEPWQYVEELMESWGGTNNQGQGDENYISVRGHQISESDADDLELSK